MRAADVTRTRTILYDILTIYSPFSTLDANFPNPVAPANTTTPQVDPSEPKPTDPFYGWHGGNAVLALRENGERRKNRREREGGTAFVGVGVGVLEERQ